MNLPSGCKYKNYNMATMYNYLNHQHFTHVLTGISKWLSCTCFLGVFFRNQGSHLSPREIRWVSIIPLCIFSFHFWQRKCLNFTCTCIIFLIVNTKKVNSSIPLFSYLANFTSTRNHVEPFIYCFEFLIDKSHLFVM